jgi:hypothetical protein
MEQVHTPSFPCHVKSCNAFTAAASFFFTSELAALGINPCLIAAHPSSAVADAGLDAASVDAALSALRQELRFAQSASRRESERARACEVDAKRCKDQAAAALIKIRDVERAAAAATERARVEVAAAAAAAKKSSEERDGEKKAAAVLKAREGRLEHEVRKLELNNDKLLRRLEALLLQKDRAQKSGIVISKTLQRLSGYDDSDRENRWRTDAVASSSSGGGSGGSRLDDAHLLSKSLAVMEGRCCALADENTSLRFALKQLQMELVDVLKASSPSRSPAALTMTTRDGDTSCIDEAVFDLPFQLAGASIEEALRNKMRRLKVYLSERCEPTSPRTAHECAAEAALLRDELASALRTIGDQEVTLRSLAAASSASVTPSKRQDAVTGTPGRSPGGASFDEIQEEENRLERARRQLQRDRSALNAAIERWWRAVPACEFELI